MILIFSRNFYYIGGISISGTALNPRAQTKRASEKAKKLAAAVGCPTDSSSKMIACLKKRPPRLISQNVDKLLVNCIVSRLKFYLFNVFTIELFLILCIYIILSTYIIEIVVMFFLCSF